MRKFQAISAIIIIVKTIFFIPGYESGGITGISEFGYRNIFRYLFQVRDGNDFIGYNIHFPLLIIEYAVIGTIIYLIYKKIKKKA